MNKYHRSSLQLILIVGITVLIAVYVLGLEIGYSIILLPILVGYTIYLNFKSIRQDREKE